MNPTRWLILAMMFSCAFPAPAADRKPPPAEAKTTADILKAVDAIKGFGTPSTAEFNRGDQRTFVVWYCPYSGRAATHAHAYRYDPKAQHWSLILNRVFEGTHDLSAEAGHAALTLRDVKGQVVYTEEPAPK